MRIPEDINQWTRLKQVSFYLESGLKIQPVYGPQEPVQGAGKKPRLSLPDRLALTPEDVLKWYANGCTDNIGQIPFAPHVTIDLDDKSTDGRALKAFWLLHPELHALPRVKTSRGVHIHVICHEIPQGVSKLTTCDLLPGLSAELYCDPRTNVILPPSIHPSGMKYEWEGNGDVLPATWAGLQHIFGFKVQTPETEKQTSTEWMRAYKGDLRTLNLVALCDRLGIYGELLKADEDKHSIKCPWRSEHTNGNTQWQPNDSSCVIYAPEGKLGAFHCMHTHCAERTIVEFLTWAHERQAGIVDRFCSKTYQLKNAADPLGPKRPYFEQEERKKECPYPRINWRAVRRKATVAGEIFKQKAFYPEDSIIGAYMIHCGAFLRSAPVYILGSLLPVIGATLARRVFMPLGGQRKYPNYFSMIAGPPGNAKSDAILYANSLATGLLEDKHHMADDVSPESLFDEYYEESGGCPDKLFMFDESNLVLANWTRSLNGKAVAARFLKLYDCGRFKENYRRNKKGEVTGGGRVIPETSTSGALGGTYGAAYFQSLESRTGLARRFSYYVAEDFGKELDGTEADQLPDIYPITELFRPLIDLKGGKLAWSTGALALWKEFQAANMQERRDVPRNDPAAIARLKSAPSAVMKVAQHFEAAIAVRQKRPFLTEISAKTLQLAILHVSECMKASAYMDSISEEEAEQDKAGVILAYIRIDFKGMAAEDGTIYLTKTQLQRRFINHGRLREFNTQTFDLKIIPRLVARGECVLLPKKERLQVYAFAPEILPPDDGEEETNPPIPPNTPGVRPGEGPQVEVDGGGIGGFDTPCKRESDPSLDIIPMADLVDLEELIPKKLPDIQFQLVEKSEQLPVLDLAKTLALDLETYGDTPGAALDGRRGNIRLLTVISDPEATPILFDLRSLGYNSDYWQSAFKDKTAIGHNLRFDGEWLKLKTGVSLSRMVCTYSASKILSNGDCALRNDLGSALARHLNIEIEKGLGKSNWGGMCLAPGQYQYAARDVVHLHKLADTLTGEITREGLRRVFELEMQLLPIVIDMQIRGMPVDKEMIQEVAYCAEAQAREHAELVREHLGAEINIDSPQQLKEAFSAIGVELENTAEDTLSRCEHPVAKLLLDYREDEMERRQATSLLEQIEPNGRIHAQFKPLGTVTGRFSSADPNLQNISRGALRSCFRAAEGFSLVVADYSQIELRVAAVIAKDAQMLKAFRDGEDLHRATAAAVLGKEIGAVSKQDRQIAKAVNFGLIYGQGAEGLVQYAATNYGVTLSLEEATRLREAFFSHYKGVAAWHRGAWKKSGKTSQGRTLLGRMRLLGTGDAITTWDRFQLLVNFPVQGTAADCLKAAMIELAPALVPYDAAIVATVHDELIVECPIDVAAQVRDLCAETMKNAAETILRNAIKIEVDAKVCQSWGDK